MAPVSLVTIHHEGAGIPSDIPRGAAGGYSIWIGADNYTVLRPPWESFATLDFNHVSLDVCLSGDRMVAPVTSNDLSLIRVAVTNARNAGWVISAPLVRPHRYSPGSNTVCPGNHTMDVWSDVVSACRGDVPVEPSVEEEPMMYPSATQPPNKFRGARVNLAAKHVDLLNAATCVPSPAVLTNPNAWIGSYGGTGQFTIVTADLDEYHFTIA